MLGKQEIEFFRNGGKKRKIIRNDEGCNIWWIFLYVFILPWIRMWGIWNTNILFWFFYFLLFLFIFPTHSLICTTSYRSLHEIYICPAYGYMRKMLLRILKNFLTLLPMEKEENTFRLVFWGFFSRIKLLFCNVRRRKNRKNRQTQKMENGKTNSGTYNVWEK